jgi:hypothetical protein
MARINWHGVAFNANPIEQLPNGNWRMISMEHGARVVPGTEIIVKQSEIIEMGAAEMPSDPSESQAKLEAAMAEERKLLPPIQGLLAAVKPQKPVTG